ncbi:MAG: hypothetical protein ACRDNW_13365 [Trebonia sp.]
MASVTLTWRGGTVKAAFGWPFVIVVVRLGEPSPVAVMSALAAVMCSGPASPVTTILPPGAVRSCR